MDPFTVTKLGDVTIQRVPSKPDDKPKVAKDNGNEAIPNNIASQIIQLPKLPPSINITVKSNSTPVNSSNNQVKSSAEVRQLPGSKFKSVSLGPGVELLKRDVKTNETKAINSGCYDTNLEKENSKEVKDKSRDDTGVDICDNDENVHDSLPSDVEGEDESDEFDLRNVSEQKMEFEDSSSSVKSDSNEGEPSAKRDKESVKFDDEEDAVDNENLDDEEFKDENVPDHIRDDIPAIPTEELPADIPEEMICKEEQYSDKESASSESEDADDEFDKEGEDNEKSVPKKKKKRKPKSDDNSEDDANEMKKQKTSAEEDKTSDGENTDKSDSAEKSDSTDRLTDLKKGQMRRNIREVMDETKLEEATLAAQRQEIERLRRVQEQQRIIREVQRQIAQNRQNSKMQARVLSLLQKGTTSIIKKEEYEEEEEEVEEELEEEEEEFIEQNKPNTVVVKLSTGSGPPQIVNKKVLDLLKKQNAEEEELAKEKFVNLSINLDKPQMMTPSVSIAPVKQEAKPVEVVNEKEEEKLKDVVMISSSSGEEDDCIVISEEEEDSEPDEDPTNSGMHTNDLFNVPDEQGRVLINVGHPESEKDVFLAPQIARIIKPHQIGGVRFLFDNIVESLNRYTTSEGFGCILAHSMGLGKTLQVVSFCDVFLRYTEGRTVLCIMPINTLQNWVAEFNMWLPTDPDSSPFKEQGEVSTRQFPIFVLNDNQKTLAARAKVIQNWHKEGGVLLIGYELYRQLSLKKPPKSRNRSKRKTEAEEDLEDEKCKNLLEVVYGSLVKPGPDLVICDEGHRIKNSHASISQALKQIRSKRRVVLTGYPLQNNLLEYWCMVDFVRPNYLGTKTEFSNMFERPIQNGQCIDSTPQDIKLMRYRAHVLHSLLEGFVQRRSHTVLQQTLPSKYEYVLLLRLTSFQRGLYNTFMNEVVRTKAVPNPLKAFAVCCKIWNHPDILYNFLKKRAGDEELDLDIEETAAGIGTPASGPSTPMTPSTPPHQTINKRTRNGRGGKGGKDAKLPRKNARNSTPQPNNKTPLIAAVPPNTVNNTKPKSPEQPVTNTNTQSVPPFNTYNNQFQNFNQQNENFEYNQQNNSNQNFNSQYRQPEFNSQNIANNADYNSTNFQQNFPDSNFYQGEFNQNNYWQGNNDGGSFYNSSNPQPTEEYFQPNATSNSQFSSSEYNASGDSPRNFNNSNYNFDLSSQIDFSADFPIKQEVGMGHFGMNDNIGGEMMMEGSGGDMSNQMFSDIPSNDMNFRGESGNVPHFGNQNVSMAMGNMNEQAMMNVNDNAKNRHPLPSFNPSQARNMQVNTRLPMNNDNAMNFNTFAAQPKPRPGRPRNVGVRSGAVGRPRKNANQAQKDQLCVPDHELMKFKPGLPGGAPILKQGLPDGQNFQNVPQTMDAQAHLLANQLTADDLNVFSQNQIGANFLDSLRSEELWNPNAPEQNTLFNEQNFIYDDPNQILNTQSTNFIGNEAPSLLGGIRATRTMLNEIQPGDNLFGAVQTNYAPANPTNDHNLFAMENFNYLNELQNSNYQLSSHTSFMGLLEGNESLSISQNAVPTENVMKANQFVPTNTPLPDSNFMDSVPFTNADLPESTINTMNTNDMGIAKGNTFETQPQLPVEKDLNQSIMGLARRNQITLKVVDKKNETQKINDNPIAEQSRPIGVQTMPSQPQAGFQNAQNRLPSIDIFNTSQNFVSTARLNQETAAYSQMNQFVFADNQTNPQSNNQNQNWENFDAPPTNDFNRSAFQRNQIMQGTTNKPQDTQFNDRRNAIIKQEISEEGNQLHMPYNSENRTMFKKDAFTATYPTPNQNQENVKDDSRNRFVPQNEQKKQNEDKTNKIIFQAPAPSKETSQSPVNKLQANMNPSNSIAAKIAEKKQQLRRNLPLSTRMEMAKQMQQKNEPFSPRQSQESSQFTPSVTIKPSAPTVNTNLPKSESKDVKPPSEDVDVKMPAPELPAPKSVKEEPGIPYDWTNEFFKDYEPGKIEASAKTLIFFCMLEEIIGLGDRILLFSQSLFTLDLIEDFLQMYNIPGHEEKWARNKSYFRLDGSTSALEREKLINEFNNNPNVHLFLVSTRAGSLGINLVGANRVVVFDASWNPCHDTQAVCRVYRYGQQKSCYVYRFVMDNCLEKKIYDRQINKQGMSDRVVDECNPDAHLTIKDVSNLCWDADDVPEPKKDFSSLKDRYNDGVIQTVIEKFSSSLSKEPFQHESLLVDRKDNKLSQAEKRMAKRSYELEKQASLRPSYGFYNNPHIMPNRMNKPMASVRPMQVDNTQAQREGGGPRRWIPAEVWQKQGMTAQEMTLPSDVVIPTNTSDSRSSIVLKAGQKVMVLKSPKGIYMQLENGKIIAIKTAIRNALSQGAQGNKVPGNMARNMPMNQGGMKMLPRPPMDRPLASLGNRRDVTVSPIRNRFAGNVRTNANPQMGGMRQGFARGPRPGQPIVRTFPLPPRPQNPQQQPQARHRPPVPGAKQIFGPNSSVTISLANKKKLEEQSNMTEVNYDEYNSLNRLKDMQNFPSNRRFEDEDELPNEYPNMNEGMTSRMLDTVTNFAPRTETTPRSVSTSQSVDQSTKSALQGAPKFADVAAKSTKFSDIIPESLRFKKDINLTPVIPAAPKTEERTVVPAKSMPQEVMRPKMSPSTSFQAQQHQQQYQQKLNAPPKPTSNSAQFPPGGSKIRKEPPLTKPTDQARVKGKIDSGLNIPESILAKKDVQVSVKNVELPAKSNSHHSISIFPVAKKHEEDSQGSSAESSHSQQGFEGDTNYQSKSQPYYSDYQKPYREYYQDKSSSESSQYSNNPYDVFKSNYPSNFPQQEYASQSQHSYGSPQYSPVPYSSHDYTPTSFSGDSHSTNPVFANQSHPRTSTGSFNSYDQYAWQNFQQQQSKADQSQPPPRSSPQ